jgi:hypothetical protein
MDGRKVLTFIAAVYMLRIRADLQSRLGLI